MRGIFNDHINAHIMSYVLDFSRGLHVYLANQREKKWEIGYPTVYLREAMLLSFSTSLGASFHGYRSHLPDPLGRHRRCFGQGLWGAAGLDQKKPALETLLPAIKSTVLFMNASKCCWAFARFLIRPVSWTIWFRISKRSMLSA